MSALPAFLVGPDPAVPDHSLLDALDECLEPVAREAARLDVEGVTRVEVDRCARYGLLAPWAPRPAGDAGAAEAPEAVAREVTERLVGASGALWFVVTQHRSPTEAAFASVNPEPKARWAEALATGQALGAVAFAHLRRPGPPPVQATRVAGGWRLDGRLDWVTSWGLADVLLLMAETEDARVVQALVPAVDGEALCSTGRLPLAAMAGTSTAGLRVDALVVPDSEVVRVLPKAAWSQSDAAKAANASPAAFGLARAAVEALAVVTERRGSAAGERLAASLAEQIRDVRREAYALIDHVPPGEQLGRRLELRAAALDLALRATTALVTAEAGRAMLLDSAAQRWAREALFLLVQAQTAELRDELLTRWTPGADGRVST
jgi:alkylation response protein AidB-like acyl-CoA dehydrogenase